MFSLFGYATIERSNNAELNDLRKSISLRKSEVSFERISVCNVTERLMEMANTVCHAPVPVMSQICYPSSYDVILNST